MIETLLSFSLRRRWIVLALAAMVLVLGPWRASQMPIDVFPDLSAPRVTIVTEVTGMASEEVESLVTYPVESVVHGLPGVRRLRSASAPGISLVWVEFDWDTPNELARQRVTERVQGLEGKLPPTASQPLLAPSSSVMGEIAFVAVTSDRVDDMQLRRVADLELRRRILAVEGVSQVVAIGGEVKQYQVKVDPLKLEALAIDMTAVRNALATGSQNAPGGYLVDQGQESTIRVLARAETRRDLEKILVERRDARAIRISDIADVVIGPAPQRGLASYNGRGAVILSVVKQPNADTVSTTASLDAALDELEPQLNARGIAVHRDVFRQQDFIDTAISNLIEVLRDGAILVIVILALFLWSFRPTLISVFAIPLSLSVAVVIMEFAGLRIDTMTLGGLAIAIGELVDDAIVDVENVDRRLRERARLDTEKRPSILATVFEASREIRSSIVAATAILMLVFLPLLTLDGMEGRLLRPLAFSYIIAISASLLVAITITPVLCSFLLPAVAEKRAADHPPMMRAALWMYRPMLRAALRFPRVMIGCAALAVLGALLATIPLGRSFLPEFNEGSLNISMMLRPGAALADSDALARQAEHALLSDSAVIAVGRRTGRAERDEHVLGVESSEFEVRLRPDPSRTKSQVFSDIRERLRAVPGAQFEIGQPISHRIDHMMSGQRSMLAVKIFGDELQSLRSVGRQIEAIAQSMPGLVDVALEQMVNIPQLVLRVDADAAARYGYSPGELAHDLGIALWGETIGQVYEDSTATDIVLKYPEHLRDRLDDIRSLRIRSPEGQTLLLGDVAAIEESLGPNYILRENVRRRLVLQSNIDDPDPAAAVERLREAVRAQVRIPEGMNIQFQGQFERAEAAGRRLWLAGAFVLVAIIMIVSATVGSARRTTIVLFNLPFALAGGIVGVYFAGSVLSIATTIGFITLFGIATRNGILLVTRVRDLESEGVTGIEAVVRAAEERLSPILMTALTAALGLLPLGLAMGQPGSEIQAPMALVILTGLISSTTLNMLVVPVAMIRWGRPREAAATNS